jgi:undecaprenyl diphosphate synthase
MARPLQKDNEAKTTLKDLDLNRLPKHIAIIMDGNGRWARERGFPRTIGHKKGIDAFKRILEFVSSLNIEVLSVYAFSTENWKRPKKEVDTLMELLSSSIKKQLDKINRKNIQIRVMGCIEDLPCEVKKNLKKAIELTKNNKGLIVNIGINYGSRREIVEGVKTVCRRVMQGQFDLETLNENSFKNFLDTKDLRDPDLVIRTGGELRLSNFMLWQSAYSELWFTDVYWPEFDKQDLIRAIYDYQQRERRFGGISIES